AQIAHRIDAYAVIGALDLHARRAETEEFVSRAGIALAHILARARQREMEIAQVIRIDIAFEPLQPIAALTRAHDEAVIVGDVEAFPFREGRWLALAEISEDHAAAHRDRIGFVLDRTAEILARRLGRLLQALAVHVVEPAVIDAAQPAILDPAVAQIGAAMRTMQVE